MHQQWIELLGDLHTGRLEEADRRRLEGHLADCEPCRELASTYEALQVALQEETSVAEDHPSAEEIVAFAIEDPELGPVRATDIAAHAAGCPTCADEIEATRRAERRAIPADRPVSRPWLPVAAVIAGTALGLALGMGWRSERPPGRDGVPKGAWSGGLLPLQVLSQPLRGVQGSSVVRLDPSRPWVALAVELDPSALDAVSKWRIEIAPPGATAAWAEVLSAEEVRERLSVDGALVLAVPREALDVGPQRLRIVPEEEAEGAEPIERPFVVERPE